MDTTESSAPAHPSTEEGPRPARHCTACGERAGSISARTGRPLVRDKESGHWFHLSCKPSAAGIGAALAGLSGLGA
jgi:hypothetical protein